MFSGCFLLQLAIWHLTLSSVFWLLYSPASHVAFDTEFCFLVKKLSSQLAYRHLALNSIFWLLSYPASHMAFDTELFSGYFLPQLAIWHLTVVFWLLSSPASPMAFDTEFYFLVTLFPS